jgi:prepilin-type N-terminal cleavage/methylation domain-containing protein
MSRRGRRQRGISLIEVLAAMTLFALVASAVGALATSALLNTTINRHHTMAAMLAQGEVEDLRSLDYPALASRASTQTVEGQVYTIDSVVAGNTPAAGMSLVTVTVRWNGPEGTRNYAVDTIFTDVTG